MPAPVGNRMDAERHCGSRPLLPAVKQLLLAGGFMKATKLIFILLFVALFVSCLPEPQPEPIPEVIPEQEHMAYFPVAREGHCTRLERVGIAWNERPIQENMDLFCASKYNTARRDYSSGIPAGMSPIIWCGDGTQGGNPGIDYYKVAQTIPASYTGEVIIFNEPENLWQCGITPQYAAEMFIRYRILLWNKKLVAPNAIYAGSFHWLDSFFDALEGHYGAGSIPIDVFGVHFYSVESLSVEQRLEDISDWLDSRGYPEMRIWVTEMGVLDFNINPATLTYERARDALRHPRVDMVYGYKPWTDWTYSNSYYWRDGRYGPVNDVGEAWIRAATEFGRR